jgi:FkbM family methyltransferase
MAVTGIKRYGNLTRNISNWGEYVFHKGKRKQRPLKFSTKPNKINFEVPAAVYHVFKEIFMEDFYKIRSLVKKLPAEPVIVDIGANAGFFDILILSKNPCAKVYAYEPLPSNVAQVKEAINNNPVLKNALEIFQYGITGLPQQSITLYTEDTTENSVVASVFSAFDSRNTRTISVPAKTLTNVLNENNLMQVDLLKIDCEGSEYDIIYNTAPAILQRCRIMSVETHEIDLEKNNVHSLRPYLESLGYRTTVEPVTEASHYLEAVKN